MQGNGAFYRPHRDNAEHARCEWCALRGRGGPAPPAREADGGDPWRQVRFERGNRWHAIIGSKCGDQRLRLGITMLPD
eukprot:2738666-Pyramimonas_sp.AAC.3